MIFTFSLGADSIENVFYNLGHLMTSQDNIDHINDITINFATSLTVEQHNAAIAAVKVARENIEWLTYHGDSISEWLTANADGAASGILINTSLLFFVIALFVLVLRDFT